MISIKYYQSDCMSIPMKKKRLIFSLFIALFTLLCMGAALLLHQQEVLALPQLEGFSHPLKEHYDAAEFNERNALYAALWRGLFDGLQGSGHLYRRAELLHRTGHVKAVAMLLEGAGSVSLRLSEKADMLYWAGYNDKSAAAYREALQRRDRIPHSLEQLARIYASSGELDQALVYIGRLARHTGLTPGSRAYTAAIASLYTQHGYFEKAKNLYTGYVQQHPDRYHGYVWLLSVLPLEETDSMYAVAEQYLEKNTLDLENLHRAVSWFSARERFDLAYRLVVQHADRYLYPGIYPHYLYLRAGLALEAGEYNAAVQDYQRLLQLRSNTAEYVELSLYREGLYRALKLAGRDAAAAVIAGELNADADALYAMLLCDLEAALQQGQFGRAMRLAGTIFMQDEGRSMYNRNARLSSMLKPYSLDTSLFAFMAAGGDAAGYVELGRFYYDKGLYALSHALLTAAYRQTPYLREYLPLASLAAFRAGFSAEGIELLRRALFFGGTEAVYAGLKGEFAALQHFLEHLDDDLYLDPLFKEPPVLAVSELYRKYE
jgi:tetratricopeptide (TPR) repeat protein